MCQKDAGRMANIVDHDQTAASFMSSPILFYTVSPDLSVWKLIKLCNQALVN